MKKLSKISSPSLYYLDLFVDFNPNNLQFAFEICKQIKLKKLLFRNYNMNNLNDLDAILNVIKDFIIRESNNLEFSLLWTKLVAIMYKKVAFILQLFTSTNVIKKLSIKFCYLIISDKSQILRKLTI